MERQAGSQRGMLGPRQQLSVAAKVVNPEPIVAKRVDHLPESRKAQDLTGNEVMTLLVRAISCLARHVDAAERQTGPFRLRLVPFQSHRARIGLPNCASRLTAPVPARIARVGCRTGPCATSQSTSRTAVRASSEASSDLPGCSINSCPINRLSPLEAMEPSSSRCIATNAGAGKGPPSSHGSTACPNNPGFRTRWAGIHEIPSAWLISASSIRSIAATRITGKRPPAPARCGPGASVSQRISPISGWDRPIVVAMGDAGAEGPSFSPCRSNVSPLASSSTQPSEASGACDTEYPKPRLDPFRTSARAGSASAR